MTSTVRVVFHLDDGRWLYQDNVKTSELAEAMRSLTQSGCAAPLPDGTTVIIPFSKIVNIEVLSE